MTKAVAPAFTIQGPDSAAAWGGQEVKFYAEDGWIFRERPGKAIECVCRYGGADNKSLSQLKILLHSELRG
jgi:hypothetical protein